MWKLASNYLFSKKYNLEFYIDDSSWLFTHKLGWRDYFTSLKLISECPSISHPIHKEFDVENNCLHQFTLNDYINIFKEIYILNDDIEKLYKIQRNLLPNMYYSIMIRRGDKMYGESKYIETSEYVKKLSNIDHLDIFIQTDDYTSYEEVYQYITNNNIKSNIITTCPSNKRGVFGFTYQPSIGSPISELNNKYLLNLIGISQKTITEYSSEEMKEHVEEMLIGLKICMESQYLVTDFQSNVTRFLLCTHSNPINVLSVGDIECPLFDIPLKCPAKGFIPQL